MKLSDFQNGTYAVGKVVGAVSARVDEKKTEPPERYTQATLLDDMMSAYKFAGNEAERTVLLQIKGLGTSRTRVSVITNLISRGFLAEVTTKGRGGKGRVQLVSTADARQIVQHLPGQLTSVATTAKWELAFRLIEEGKATPADVDRHLDNALAAIVDDAKRRGKGGLALAGMAGAQQK